jgi:cysteine desulfurase
MSTDAYLDFNATAPVRSEVAAAVARALEIGGNASSVHGRGRAARRAIEDARQQVAKLVAVRSEEVVFTAGGTEANNLALTGSGRSRILVSAIEHDSVMAVCSGAEIIPVNGNGLIDPVALSNLLAADETPALVSVMLANNETGVVQQIQALADVAHQAGALFHCDAVQAAGKTPVDAPALGIDLLSLSSHKLGGLQGVGALVVLNNVELAASVHGGGQERGRRAGTENLPGIIGFGVAAEIASHEASDQSRLAGLRDALESQVLAIAPDAEIHSSRANRIANTICLSMPGVEAETQVMSLDLAGVMVSAGAACSSGKVQTSHVLSAMGVDEDLAASAIRVSLGWSSVESDVDAFVAAWGDLYRRLVHRQASAA